MANTEVLSKSLDEFVKSAKIKDDEYKNLRTRRNTITGLIKEYAMLKDLSVVDEFNVGSYKIRTGVKRNGKNGWAFDIDYVFVFNKEFEYETFKAKLTSWLRDKVKEKYSWNVIVYNKKKVVTVAFRNKDNESTMFYLDIALYLKKDDCLFHIVRDEHDQYNLIHGDPKETYRRQKDSLSGSQSKRNAIIALKYLKEKGRIIGASSIFITDSVIEYLDYFDTFTLFKKFIEKNQNKTSFELKETPNSELIKSHSDLNSSLTKMNEKFFESNTTVEIHKAMNNWMDNALGELDVDELEERESRYSGG